MEKQSFRIFFATKTHEQERKPVVAGEEKDQWKGVVSTELSLWYGISAQTDHKASRSESSSSVPNRKRMVPESTDVAALTKNDANNIARTTTEHEKVSTELKLGFSSESPIIKKRKMITGDYGDSFASLDPERERRQQVWRIARQAWRIARQTRRIGRLRVYSNEDEQEERRLGVSTRLKLYEDPWKIKKKLTQSDVDGSSRLLVGKELFQQHILPFLDDHRAKLCSSVKGLEVTIFDNDTGTEHQLVLKTWPGTSSKVLTSNWKQEFVRRRSLESIRLRIVMDAKGDSLKKEEKKSNHKRYAMKFT
ncbi:hypothetical protein F0562_007084 [Nyssa sinensis]|uniref:B3 domain-containing protein n=1 Tax=Nyssa sinensis TaxID=561372 RepID=A0A5J5A4D5_9ASTE|nr:hypothetical protein F0562_007084 [Nyssa sinensis]